jgi:hypothetical protein
LAVILLIRFEERGVEMKIVLQILFKNCGVGALIARRSGSGKKVEKKLEGESESRKRIDGHMQEANSRESLP